MEAPSSLNANGSQLDLSQLDLSQFHRKIQHLFRGNQDKLRMIDDWVLMETVGIGGSSKVKLGVNKRNGKEAAIKIMFADESGQISASKKKQWLRELNVMKKVNHPNIIKLINFNDHAEYPEANGTKTACLMTAFEFAAGGELFDYLMYTAHFDDIATRTYLKQLINGLEALHNVGIAHRDLKPENLLMDSSFTLKIADFGFSTEFKDSNTGKLKCMKTPCGTKNYLAPEIWKGQKYSFKTDIFAVGIILFIMYAGFPPFMEAQPNDWWWDKYSIALEKLQRAHQLGLIIKENASLKRAESAETKEMNACYSEAQKRMRLFWKAHSKKRKFQDDDFKDIALNLIHPDPEKRMDIKDIKRHKWMTKGPCYTKHEAKEYLTKRVKTVLQGRAKKIKKLMQDQKKKSNVNIKGKEIGERIDDEQQRMDKERMNKPRIDKKERMGDINKGFVVNIKGAKHDLFIDSLFHFITYVSPVKMAGIIKRTADKNGGKIRLSPQNNSMVICCHVSTEKLVFSVQMYLLDDIDENEQKRQPLSERDDVRYLVMFKRLNGTFDGYSKIVRKFMECKEITEVMECDDIDVDKSTNIIRNDAARTSVEFNTFDLNGNMDDIDLITRYIALNRIVHTLQDEMGGNGNSSKSSLNHRDSNNNNNECSRNNKGDCNNNNDNDDNDNNNGGSGGYGNSDNNNNDDDDDKNNDKNNKKKGVNMDEDDEEEKEEEKEKKEDELDEDAIFDVLNNMDKYNDKELRETLCSLSPNVLPKISKEISKLTADIDRLYNIWNIKTKFQSSMRKKKRSKSMGKALKQYINTYNAPKTGDASYRISRTLTNKIIPSLIKENISDLYSFMIKSLAMDANNIGNGKMKIVNFDFHDKKDDKSLYCIAEKQNESNWKIKDALFTKHKIMDIFNIQCNKLPKAIADQYELHVVSDDIDGISQKLMKRKYKIIQNTSWCNIPIYKRNNNKRKVTLSLTKEEFIKDCRNYIEKQDKIDPIPIIMFDHNGKYQIEYVWIMRINENNDIGVSFQYDKTSKDKIKISGIHLDKQHLISSHELISTQHCNKCHCFDNFKSYITDINIGNVCLFENKIKDLQKKLNHERTKNKNMFIELKQFKQNVNNLRNERIKLKQEISKLQEKWDKAIFTENKKVKSMKRRNSLSLSKGCKSMSICHSISIETSPSIILNGSYRSQNTSLISTISTPITPPSIQQMALPQNINITQNIKVISNNNITSVQFMNEHESKI